MKDKELMMKAIEEYSLYTPYQRQLLKSLVALSVNDVAIITPSKLARLTKMTRSAVYYALKRFESDGVVIRKKGQNNLINAFRLDALKLEDILTIYKIETKYFDKI